MNRLTQARDAELKYLREQNDMDITKTREMAGIETSKFKNMVDAIGAPTIQAIATAGPDMQVGDHMKLSGWCVCVRVCVFACLRVCLRVCVFGFCVHAHTCDISTTNFPSDD